MNNHNTSVVSREKGGWVPRGASSDPEGKQDDTTAGLSAAEVVEVIGFWVSP